MNSPAPHYTTISRRIKRGMDPMKAKSAQTPNRHYITAEGRTQTMAAWAREKGITTQTIYRRIARGWSEADAVSRPLINAPRLITVRGRTRTLSQWSKRYGVPVSTIWRRLACGWTEADAVSWPVRKHNPYPKKGTTK